MITPKPGKATATTYRGLCALFLLFIISSPLYAQNCSCAESFDEVVQTIEENYALFRVKVTAENRELYDAFTEVMREQAANIQDLDDCLPVLDRWRQFFRDGHTWIRKLTPTTKSYDTFPIDEKRFKAAYKSPKKRKEDIIGIWKSGSYTVAILPEPKPLEKNRDYIGVILESGIASWKPTEIKFELQKLYGNGYGVNFFMGDHSLRKAEASLKSQGQLSISGLNDWYKVWPQQFPGSDTEQQASASTGFHFEMLEGEIPYFRFPNFWYEYKPLVDSLVRQHHEQLARAEFMIIDVRTNDGGSDNVYYPLMPYILTEPIQLPDVGYLLSVHNKSLIAEEWGVNSVNLAELNEEELAIYQKFLDSSDTVVFFGKERYYTYQPDTFYTSPKKVAILISEKTVSSGETFVIRAKKSPRVVLYGQNTSGTVDGFDVKAKNLSCFSVHYPTAIRSFDVGEHPIDPYGIAPDVYLNKTVDALDFAIQHLKSMQEKSLKKISK